MIKKIDIPAPGGEPDHAFRIGPEHHLGHRGIGDARLPIHDRDLSIRARHAIHFKSENKRACLPAIGVFPGDELHFKPKPAILPGGRRCRRADADQAFGMAGVALNKGCLRQAFGAMLIFGFGISLLAGKGGEVVKMVILNKSRRRLIDEKI